MKEKLEKILDGEPIGIFAIPEVEEEYFIIDPETLLDQLPSNFKEGDLQNLIEDLENRRYKATYFVNNKEYISVHLKIDEYEYFFEYGAIE